MATSTCPRCFAGTCKEHSKAALGSAAAEKADLMQRMYDNLVGKQLEKLKKAKDAAKLDADTAQYRDSLARSRDKKREKKSSKSKGSSSSNSVAALHSGSGLNPQALAAICSSDDDATTDKRSSKRDKKRKKDSKKDSKKPKKAKKTSKSSKKRRASTDSSSDGSSDSDSSDSSRGARPSKKRHRHD